MIERREGHQLGRVVRQRSASFVALAALAGVVGGIAAWAAGARSVADAFWAATTALLLVPLTVSVVRSLLRRDVGVDAIALVSMAGALALGEYLAGAVVALMLAGGNALEERANRRAARELTSLIERAPRRALVRRGDGLVEVPVRSSCPATVWSCARARSSRSTGWSRARRRCSTSRRSPASRCRSRSAAAGRCGAGRACAGAGVRAERAAAGGGEHLRRARAAGRAGRQRASARSSGSPIATPRSSCRSRPWSPAWPGPLSGDPVRALAVFVVATPCPLILAAPIALSSGLSRCARAGRRRQGRRDDRATRQGALGAARQDGHA